ncbi:hypothetical protein ACH5RR_014275 [Cinchona calisaya]|uniref:Uncharacterized protein n=1 Tax=Cinchona calisaya TaxID=153742 RepID=A0ABD3A889_9GENT
MARKRKAGDGVDHENNSSLSLSDEGNIVIWDEMVKDAAVSAALGGARRARKRGANTRTNFWPNSSSSSSIAPALPSRITNLLLSRLKARNNSLAAADSSVPRLDDHQQQKETEEYPDEQFTDFLNDLDEYSPEKDDMMIGSTNNSSDSQLGSSSESCLTQNDDHHYEVIREQPSLDLDCWGDIMVQSSNGSTIEEEIEEELEEENNNVNLGIVDFDFVDEIGSCCYNCSLFEIAGEMSQPMEFMEAYGGDDPSMLSEAMKRMNYERKFSASLYAFNGITECLKLKKLKSGSVLQKETSEQLTRLRNACNKNNLDQQEQDQNERLQLQEDNAELIKKQEEEEITSNCDGESSLWSSIDLPPICYVN